MAIGERIKFIRKLRGITQKSLGMLIGFDEKTADVRMAQYETGTRSPKSDYTYAIATALDVSPKALDVPDIDSYAGLAHTLFALEDMYGLTVSEVDGHLCLRLDESKGAAYLSVLDILSAWHKEYSKLQTGAVSKEDYDNWRYNYPQEEKQVIYL